MLAFAMRERADPRIAHGVPMMTLAEIWPTLKNLSREDKRSLLEALSAEVNREEAMALTEPGRTHEVWSPFDADEAAAKLRRFLDESESSK
jgi:hypothetical protein